MCVVRRETVVVGGGPAGLTAAREAAFHGSEVLLLDRNEELGGQLVKQTHRFFGSLAQHAGVRGIDIADILVGELRDLSNVTLLAGSDVLGYYPDGTVAYQFQGGWHKAHPECLIIATGASERSLAFPGCDLPGVYGAGAVQTLMNVHGVRPGERVLMVGAGNIGLIVSYQLLQAGTDVAAVVEAAPRIGGYTVHASKLRRLGVPILTQHSVSRAHGEEAVTGATIVQLDDDWKPIGGTEMEVDCDAICLAVGLSPLTDLLWQAGCDMVWIGELGGYVPVSDEQLRTSHPGIFVAGDARGIEEASAAMMEGSLAGLSCARFLGYVDEALYEARFAEITAELDALRGGPTSEKLRSGLERVHRVPSRRHQLVEGSDGSC